MYDNPDDTAQLAQQEREERSKEVKRTIKELNVMTAHNDLFTTGRAETNVGIETLSDHAEVFEDNQHEIESDFSTFESSPIFCYFNEFTDCW